MSHRPAIVLVSGGLDSTTCLAIARQEGFSPLYSMSFDYGQRHRQELESARRISSAYGVQEHRVVHIDMRQFGKSALTDDIAVPKDRDQKQMGADIPITYVPARNTIFLSYVLAWAEVLGAMDVFIGVNAIDYSGYPDCRPEFIEAFERLANLATRMTVSKDEGGKRADQATAREPMKDEMKESDRRTFNVERSTLNVLQSVLPDSSFIPHPSSLSLHPSSLRFRIHTPLIRLTKAEIIKRGVELGVDYGLTHSCYDPDEQGRACGRCDSCLLRKRGFAEAGVVDPTEYGK